ncbi:bifunctional adenosylcobinamide kinase/adenosylcobinamide-phosphate guanylyltransferase [Bacillus sp. S/N-304-OC-R1]|uniref:bifunctional adenosylcobinamide kinase/adenosylcobinamide-phosphate guanylyltransferase n=1 Tax=Bacillus sp. S/N-304-OC-R1 TaxID=2758034 RepID=UPI001C8EB0C2|nr:bifunctional adenosylcobinamide kinase/adenosylcobinamide-phosphate guanylyltransferase [Bacillus sp. S/N-304-OC-R1]MBY0121186.1 bifunctional adenosylcobinamide kinase/adenosylcobinamide-phosphate guanylyltransferase [Bacillus sp. S/N-304-OC-R1]
MHFVTGGAFNGKSKWVTEYYKLKETPHLWISGYRNESVEIDFHPQLFVILEGIEIFLKGLAAQHEINIAREKWQMLLTEWSKWENEAQGRQIILIGTDMNKGIVPIRAEDRKWRDFTGWAYQDTARLSERTDVIWYGISRRIK